MENNNQTAMPAGHGKGGIIAMSIGLLVVGLIAGFVLGKGTQPKAINSILPPSVSPTATPAVTITTYTNSKMGYQIDYPSDWTVEAYEPSEYPKVSILDIVPPNPEIIPCTLPTNAATYISINKEDRPLAEIRKMYSSKVGGQDLTESVTRFAGQTAYLYAGTDSPVCPDDTDPSSLINNRIILLEHKGSVITLFTMKYQMPEVQKILSTFRFVTNPVGLKTYTNTEYGFEFKYPSSYAVSNDVLYAPIVGEKIAVFSNNQPDPKKSVFGVEVIKKPLSIDSIEGFYGKVDPSRLIRRTINGHTAYEFGEGEECGILFTDIENGSYTIRFGASVCSDTELVIRDQVLSTFRFTK